jgi:hypothetical protein
MAFAHNSTTSDSEPAWADVDKTRLPRAAFADQGEPDAKSTWGYPHHWVQNGGDLDESGCYTTGTMYLHLAGLNAAWSAANGGRSGVEASPEVKSHLNAHRKALGLDEPQKDSPQSDWQRAAVSRGLAPTASGRRVGVDRENEIIFGMVVAQEGVFKDERGEFDQLSLQLIDGLMRAAPNGLRCHLAHPDLSGDGVGKLLGRVRDPWFDTLGARESNGQLKTDIVQCIRADLHLDPSSHVTPSGDIARYVMKIAESDSDAISSSLVLLAKEEYRINADGTPVRGPDGFPLPPLWRPTVLHASDIVDTGAAVDGLLSAQLAVDGLPDGVVRRAAELMDRQFAGKPRMFIRERCLAWLNRYLNRRYGPPASEDLDDSGGDQPDARHDGCRSNQGLHYQKECRQCGAVIRSCGCKDRSRESRVIRMGVCEECQAKPPKLPPEEPPMPMPGLPEDEQIAVERHRRRAVVDLMEINR